MFRQVTRAVATLRPGLTRSCSDGVRNIPTYHPDSLDKKILVHFKYFKTVEEIPHRVSQSMMAQVCTVLYAIVCQKMKKNLVRIKSIFKY